MMLGLVAAAAAAIAPAASRLAVGQGGGNLEYWLNRAKPPASAPATREGVSPFGGRDEAAASPHAVPGVVELSDGRQLPGWISTTPDRDLEVWHESEERWRRVPLITVLSIRADVVEAGMEQEWRWKEMGTPERVYTGREFPKMRLQWRLHLIDDSTVVGPIKGQPLWIALNGKRHGPFVLHERTKGQFGQKVSDIVYIKQVVISRRMMENVLAAGPPPETPLSTTRPAGSN
jgi:hypothetical protein